MIFLFSCVDGFISNWLYPARLPLLYRDFLILFVYLLFISREPVGLWMNHLRRRVGRTAWLFALLFLLVGILQIFNPLSASILVGLVGFKVLFMYWPLAVVAYAYVDSLDRARRLFKTIVYFSVPINLFGLYQFWKGPSFLVSTFGPGFERAIFIAHIEGLMAEKSFFRVVGTFASSGQFSNFIVLNAMLCLALLFSASTKRERLVFSGCATLNFLSMLATGSRGGLMVLIAETLIFAILNHRARPALAAAFLLATSFYFGFSWLGDAVIRRFESLQDVDMIRQRAFETTQEMFTDVLQEYPLGRGLGTGSPASRYILGEESTGWTLVENNPSKLQLETGIFGVIFFYLFMVALSLRWIRSWHRSLDLPAYDFVAAISAFCLTRFALSFFTGGFDSPPGAVFLWALVGMVARISTLSSAGEIGGRWGRFRLHATRPISA